MLAVFQYLGHRIAAQLFGLLYKFPVICGQHAGQVPHSRRRLQLGHKVLLLFDGRYRCQRRECLAGVLFFQLRHRGFGVGSAHGFEPVRRVDLGVEFFSGRGFIRRLGGLRRW